MENNSIDVTKELQQKNQEILFNKKIIDLDTAMESLLVFYNNYCTNVATDINNQICHYRNVDLESEQGKIFYNTITSFFLIVMNKLKEIITKDVKVLKSHLPKITDEEYTNELSQIRVGIIKQMADYYVESIDMLSNELTQDANDDIKNRISNYLLEMITVKMLNMLKDKVMFFIKVINNNYEENYQVMENINEKTLNNV